MVLRPRFRNIAKHRRLRLNREQKFPMVSWIRDDIYRVSFIENAKNVEYLFSGSDLGALIARAGGAFQHKYKSEELKEHDLRCAI
jgi:hypothetical protein